MKTSTLLRKTQPAKRNISMIVLAAIFFIGLFQTQTLLAKSYKYDAGVIDVNSPIKETCPGKHLIQCYVRNFGTATFTQVTINWKRTKSGAVTSKICYGSFAPDSNYIVTCDSSIFTSGIDTVYAWTTLPNGVTDSMPSNDSLAGIIIVLPVPKASFDTKDTAWCISDSALIAFSGASALSYSLDFGDGTSTFGTDYVYHHYSTGGTYLVSISLSMKNGCSDKETMAIFIDSSCVWPGDADHSKHVNSTDLLAIGVAYGSTGPNRIHDSVSDWRQRPCQNWSSSFTSGANYKHSDCNGDGVVDSNDIWAIYHNYGDSHLKTGPAGSGNPSDPALSVSVSADSVSVKDVVKLDMNLGTSSKPVSSIYGLSFGVTYDPNNINLTGGIGADFSKSMLGTPGKNLIYLTHNDVANGIMYVAVCRTDHTSISGYGTLGVLSIIMPDNVAGKKEIRKELNFNIVDVKAIDNKETIKSLYTVNDSVLLVDGPTTGIKNTPAILDGVQLYPNPVTETLHIVCNQATLKNIKVMGLLGETIMVQTTENNNQTNLSTGALKPGIYFIDITTNQGTMRTRFVKE